MAIAYKAEAHAEKTASNTNPLTITINVPSGIVDGIVDVTVECVGAPTQSISTATYDGSNMTSRVANGGSITGTSDNFQHVEHWYFKLGTSPGTGNRNIVLTPSATCRMNGQAQIRDGVDQTTPYPANDSSAASAVSGSPITVDVPSTISGEFVCDGAFASGAGTLTEGGGQSPRTNFTGTSDVWAGSDEAGNGGTVTMSWTIDSSRDWVTLAWRLTPSSVVVMPDMWHPPIERQLQRLSEIVAY